MTREERAYNYASKKNPSKFTVGEISKHYDDGYTDGYNDAIKKACEWLKANHADIFIRYIRGYEADDEIKLFKEYMEGKQ